MSPRRIVVVVTLALAVAACGADGDDDGDGGAATSTTSTAPAPPSDAVEPGRVVVIAGDRRFDLLLFECLVGDETGAPTRRLALSASATEPFLDSDTILNVDILVSQVTGDEEHRITLLTPQGELAASDTTRSAPDDWIAVDEDSRVVRGRGFELAPTDGSAMALPAGTLVADCPVGRA